MKCRDCDAPSDPAFLMRFDDIGEPPLHWCAEHGDRARAMVKMLDKAFATRPNFARDLEAEMNKLAN